MAENRLKKKLKKKDSPGVIQRIKQLRDERKKMYDAAADPKKSVPKYEAPKSPRGWDKVGERYEKEKKPSPGFDPNKNPLRKKRGLGR